MKYCEIPVLTEFSRQLSQVVGDTYVCAAFELYTTKPASSDKRLIRVLDQQINDTLPFLENSFTGSYVDPPQLLSPPIFISDKLRKGSGSGSGSAGSSRESTAPPMTPGSAGIHGGIAKRRARSTPSFYIGNSTPFGPLAEVGNIKQYAYLIAVLNASDPDRDFSALQPSSFRRIYSDVVGQLTQTLDALGLKAPAALWQTLEDEITPLECKVYSLELPQQFLEDDDSGISWSKMFFFFNKRRKRVLFVNLNSRPASYRINGLDDEEVVGELE